MAATRLAVREARSRTEPSAPLHLVGFSNGGALALMYALDSLSDEKLSRPDRLVLISPMVGITRFARFAGLAGLPAILPAFAKAAWLGIVPEFNPFKYNSFPVNGARQSYRLTRGSAGADRPLCPRRQAGSVAADPHLSIADRFHGKYAGHRVGALCASSRERPRTGAVRCQPHGQVRSIAPLQRRYRARAYRAERPAALSPHHHHQCR